MERQYGKEGMMMWKRHLAAAYGNEQVRIMGAQLADMDGTGVRCGAIAGYTEHIPKINLHKSWLGMKRLYPPCSKRKTQCYPT